MNILIWDWTSDKCSCEWHTQSWPNCVKAIIVYSSRRPDLVGMLKKLLIVKLENWSFPQTLIFPWAALAALGSLNLFDHSGSITMVTHMAFGCCRGRNLLCTDNRQNCYNQLTWMFWIFFFFFQTGFPILWFEMFDLQHIDIRSPFVELWYYSKLYGLHTAFVGYSKCTILYTSILVLLLFCLHDIHIKDIHMHASFRGMHYKGEGKKKRTKHNILNKVS